MNTTNLTRPGKKNEHISLLFTQGAVDELHDDGLRRGLARRSRKQRQGLARIPRFDGKQASFGGDDGSIVEQSRNGLAIQGGRHDQDLEARRQVFPGVECQGEAEIGLQAPLMELIEDNGGEVFECRVMLQNACEDAFRDDLDASLA